MDLIYADARLTIIAVAGENPDYGLPGVNAHPMWSVNTSKWASRGWTYQEGLLSKRRLVFTDELVFYECNGMDCAESFVLPLDELHIKSKKKFKDKIPLGAFIHKTPGKEPWQVMYYMAEFSMRDLTFPGDAINAMQGIFNSFSNSRRPVYQFVGVPILPPEATLNHHRSYRPTNRSPEECFLIGLSWSHIEPGVRRPDFPSLSWAGWVGELYSSLMFPEDSFSRLNDVKLWIEDDDGTLLSFPERPENLQPFLSSREYCKNRFLHLEGITIQFSVEYLQRDLILSAIPEKDYRIFENVIGRDGYYAKFPADKDTFIYAEVTWDAEVDWDQREQDFQQTVGKLFTGICVGEGSDGFVLVVEEMGRYAERVGYFQLEKEFCAWYNNDNWIAYSGLESQKNWIEEIPKVRQKIRLG